MNTCCEISYNKKDTSASFCCKISDVQKIYDPDKFAKWLTDAFEASPFKSWEDVAQALKKLEKELGPIKGATRSTLSRYAGAKPQATTGKRSQPNPTLVIGLAKLFDADVDNALREAGHATLNQESNNLRGLLRVTEDEMTPEQRKLFLNSARALAKEIIKTTKPDFDFNYADEE